MPNLRSKIFQNFFVYRVWSSAFLVMPNLRSEFVGEGFGPCTNFLWSYQIWHQTFFCLQSTLDSEFFLEAGVPSTNFFGSSQIWNQILEFFCLQSALSSEFSGMVWNWVWLWTLNFFGKVSVRAPTFFWSCQIWGQKFFLEFFRLQKSLDSEVFGGGFEETFFGHAKYEV